MKNKTLFILGSSRSDGNTRKVVDYLMDQLPSDLLNLKEFDFSYYDYEFKNQEDDFFGLAKSLLEYDTLIFCSPVYWYSMSAIMKTFFDRMSDLLKIHKPIGRALAGKNMFALCCSSDETKYDGFFMPFEKTAGYLDMTYGGDIHTWMEDGKIPDEAKEKIDVFIQKIIATQK